LHRIAAVLTRLTPLIALVALLALPTASPAAVSLGQTAAPGAQTCAADIAAAQTSSSAPEYTVRTPGVITELRTEGHALEGNKLHVFRPRGNNSFTVLASVPVVPAPGVIRVPVRVPVQPGDVLGFSTGPDAGQNCFVAYGDNAQDFVAGRDGAAPDEGEVTLSQPEAARLNVGATLEPDGDGDGFGDETQDACPDDRTRTMDGCAADLFVSQLSIDNDIERDDVNVITVTVRNNGSSLARDVRVTEAIPAGLQLIGTTPSIGGCAGGAPVDCTFPSIPAGGSESILVVLRAVATGSRTLTATVGSPTPDPNGANNVSELAFDVQERRSVVAPGTFCRVPRLFGLSRITARRAILAAGCRMGRTSRRKFRSGRYNRVRQQTIPPGTRVAIRTRVGIVVRRR
jgi:uncharacterized repeat protein (TIGR01451 family)